MRPPRRRGGGVRQRSGNGTPRGPASAGKASDAGSACRRSSTAARRLLLAAVGFLLLPGLLLFDPRLFTGGDNVVYYLLARAIATGQGYVTLHEPGEPPQTIYPPGYPLLLAPVYWVSGGNLWVAKAFSFVAAAVALVLIARFLAQRLAGSEVLALAFGILLTVTNSTFLALSHETLTEMPFLVVSFGALLLAESDRREPVVWLGAAALAAAGYLIRTAALPLCVAVVWVLWRGHGRGAGVAAAGICLMAILGWSARNLLVAPDAPSYLDQLVLVDPYVPSRGTLTATTLVQRVAANVAQYAFVEVPRLFWPFWRSLAGPQLGGIVLGAVLAPLAALGFVRQVRGRGLRAGDLYALLYLALLGVWAWNGDRFLLPIFPLILSYIGLGLAALPAFRARAPTWLAAVVCALTLLPNLGHALRRLPGQLAITGRHLRGDRLAGYSEIERDFLSASIWIGENAPAGAVVVSRKPQFTYLFSDRKSVIYPYAAPDEIERVVQEVGADYVIYDLLGFSSDYYLRPHLLAYVDRYGLAHSVGDPPTLVFRREAP